MKRPAAILLPLLFFCTAFAAGKGNGAARPELPDSVPDSLRSVYLYTEGIKRQMIRRDTAEARALFTEAIRRDSAFAPAYYELAGSLAEGGDGTIGEVIRLAGEAARRDTANKWYQQFYGQALLIGNRYDEALGVYRSLTRSDAQNPENFRLLAALYAEAKRPYEAIAVLDSAELRFGRIPVLGAAKRRLLIDTRQYDRALSEAQALVEAAPYEAENHVALGELYGLTGRDSLAAEAFAAAIEIDPTDIATLVAAGDYYNRRQNYAAFLAVTRRLFDSDELTAESKVAQFGRLTADLRFYREYFLQINELAALLALKYPADPQVADLYGKHLIASGQLDEALELYKAHTADRPPVKEYFTMVIDIESYKQRPDSAERYIAQALRLFPDDPDFRIARGHTHVYGKRYKEAVKSYRDALPYVAGDSLRGLIWGYIGDAFHASGDQRQSYKAYDKSLRYYSENASVLNNYAYFLAEEGSRLEKALDMSGRAIALDGNNPTYLDTYAWVLFKLGRTAEAKKSMQLAISLDGGKSPDLQLHYGDILAASGEKFMAEVYWRKALENGYEDPEAVARRFEWLERSPKTEKTEGR